MRAKFSALIAALLVGMMVTTMQCGCGKENKQVQGNQIEQGLSTPEDQSKIAVEASNINEEAVTKSADNGVNKEAGKEVGKGEDPFKEKWVNATKFIQNMLAATPGANEKISKEETDALFDSLIDDIENGLNDESIVYYRICNIIASMHHIHMSLGYTHDEQYPQGEWLGMDLLWTQQGLILTGADEAYKEDLGRAVTKINGYRLQEIMDLYATIQPQETEAGKKNCFYNIGTSNLKYLGIMKEDENSIVLSLKDAKGKEKEMVYTFKSKEEQHKWCTVVSQQNVPFTYKTRIESNFQNYSYVEKPEDGIMYFQYLACMGQDGMTFSNFFKEMMGKMKAKDNVYDTLVIDVRWNGGGNRYMLQDMLIKYKDYLRTKHICIITDFRTASAGVQVIEDCLAFFDDVTTYGGPTCGAVHNYTQISETPVPGTDMILRTPTKLDTLPELTKKYGDVTESAMPDVPVQISIKDFENGIDTIYERIVQDKISARE